jgi:hypothetical protein
VTDRVQVSWNNELRSHGMLTYVDQSRDECELTPRMALMADRARTRHRVGEATETILRDVAFVLHMTRKIRAQITRDPLVAAGS